MTMTWQGDLSVARRTDGWRCHLCEGWWADRMAWVRHECPVTLEIAEQPAERKSVLVEAEGLVHGDRNATYGPPTEDFARTAKIWSAILGCEVKPYQVALCMMGVKMSRLVNKPSHRDSWTDAAGYAECGAWVEGI